MVLRQKVFTVPSVSEQVFFVSVKNMFELAQLKMYESFHVPLVTKKVFFVSVENVSFDSGNHVQIDSVEDI